MTPNPITESRNRTADPTLGRLAMIAALFIAPELIAQQDDAGPPRPVRIERQQASQTTGRPRYSYGLGRKLNARESCFDVSIGDVLGGVVPIGPLTDSEKAQLRNFWERLLSANAAPTEKTTIEWRKIQWSLVDWQPPRRHSKDPAPPRTDVLAARWFVAGSPVIVGGSTYRNGIGTLAVTVTIRLTGADRLFVQYPRHYDSGVMWRRLDDSEIEKPRLLAILTTKFRFPWKSADEFEVEWSPSPVSDGHLRLVTSRPRPGSKKKPWFEEVGLTIKGANPQRLSIGAVLHISADDE